MSERIESIACGNGEVVVDGRGLMTARHWTDNGFNPAGGVTEGKGFLISWQDGPLGKVGSPERKEPNGACVEDVIWAVVNRLEFFQGSELRCNANEEAMSHLHRALYALAERTKARTLRGVEGTYEP